MGFWSGCGGGGLLREQRRDSGSDGADDPARNARRSLIDQLRPQSLLPYEAPAAQLLLEKGTGVNVDMGGITRGNDATLPLIIYKHSGIIDNRQGHSL